MLKIFDLRGREVAILVDAELTSGQHRVVFEPKEFPGGVYLYKIEAESFHPSKKLVLLH